MNTLILVIVFILLGAFVYGCYLLQKDKYNHKKLLRELTSTDIVTAFKIARTKDGNNPKAATQTQP